MIPLRSSVSGRPSTIASIFTPNVSSSFVFLYKRFFKRSTSAPFRSSNTIRIPSLEDSLEISRISVVTLFSMSAMVSDKNLEILFPIIVYGISEITSLSFSPRFFAGSKVTFPLNFNLPVPEE